MVDNEFHGLMEQHIVLYTIDVLRQTYPLHFYPVCINAKDSLKLTVESAVYLFCLLCKDHINLKLGLEKKFRSYLRFALGNKQP